MASAYLIDQQCRDLLARPVQFVVSPQIRQTHAPGAAYPETMGARLHTETAGPSLPAPGRALASERCIPCEAGVPPLPLDEAQALLSELDARWHVARGGRSLTREITFKSFGRAMAFLNRLAELAEGEGHHPDFCLKRWNHVSLTLTTHAIGGLSRNDFVLAAKLESLIRPPSSG